MFDTLSDKLEQTIKRLRGHGKIDERNIEEAVRDVRLALLEADVQFDVVRDFMLTRSSSGLSDVFWWTDPGVGRETHVNVVTDKRDLVPPRPHRATRGVAAEVCEVAVPTDSCRVPARGASVEFFQVLAACGPSGDDEGPIR